LQSNKFTNDRRNHIPKHLLARFEFTIS
jgi:hypothetical protein